MGILILVMRNLEFHCYLAPIIFKENSKCKRALYQSRSLPKQLSLIHCLEKCLDYSTVSLLLNYGKGSSCTGNPAKCRCICYRRPDEKGGCETVTDDDADLYKIVFSGKWM